MTTTTNNLQTAMCHVCVRVFFFMFFFSTRLSVREEADGRAHELDVAFDLAAFLVVLVVRKPAPLQHEVTLLPVLHAAVAPPMLVNVSSSKRVGGVNVSVFRSSGSKSLPALLCGVRCALITEVTILMVAWRVWR